MTNSQRTCHVYVLSSTVREYLYVGLTYDLVRRIGEHQRGKETTTRAYIPFEVLLTEAFVSRQAARSREKYLKTGAGKEFLKDLRASHRKE